MGTEGLDVLFDTLEEEGFTIVGPTVRDQTVVYEQLHSPTDLPVGIGDDQEGGHYRLVDRSDDARFGYNLGQTSWKRFLYPPRTDLFRVTRDDDGIVFEPVEDPGARYAFVGVRACELAAIGVQDGVFTSPNMSDPTYARRRDEALFVAVNCGQAAPTCFCTSMGTGPRCTTGFDIVMTEILDGDDPRYVVDSGSDRGSDIMRSLPGRETTSEDMAHAEESMLRAERDIVRRMETEGIRDLLVANP